MQKGIEFNFDQIARHEKVTQLCGRWPSFHDSEILAAQLGREGVAGPILRLEFLLMKPALEKQINGIKDLIVELIFEGVDLELLNTFNEQNVVFDVLMGRGEAKKHRIEIQPSYGCEMIFTCERMSVGKTMRLEGSFRHDQMAGQTRNIQIIDGAENCVYDVFSASQADFDILFSEGTDIAFIDEIEAKAKGDLGKVLERLWSHPVQKMSAMGIHGIIFFGLENKKKYYPDRRDSTARNPDGSSLRNN